MKKKMKMLYEKTKTLKKKDRMTAVQNLATDMAEMNLNNPQGKKIIQASKLSKSERKLLKKIEEYRKSIVKYNVSGRVMLTRNPCMHPADIRVVNCISRQEAEKRFRSKGLP